MTSKDSEQDRKYKPPVSIPLDFERAVEGLVNVKPVDMKEAEAKAEKPKVKRTPKK